MAFERVPFHARKQQTDRVSISSKKLARGHPLILSVSRELFERVFGKESQIAVLMGTDKDTGNITIQRVPDGTKGDPWSMMANCALIRLPAGYGSTPKFAMGAHEAKFIVNDETLLVAMPKWAWCPADQARIMTARLTPIFDVGGGP